MIMPTTMPGIPAPTQVKGQAGSLLVGTELVSGRVFFGVP
jgi:hypothetical protein